LGVTSALLASILSGCGGGSTTTTPQPSTAPVKVGDKTIPGDFKAAGFVIGQDVTIGAGTTNEEDNNIVAFGSMILKNPLKFAHDAGTLVSVKAGPPGAPTAPPGPTTTTTTTPGPPAPPPSPAPCTGDCRDIKVLSYNLEWHSQHDGLNNIVKTINANGHFDLLGMQECENIGEFINRVGTDQGTHYDSFQVTPGPGSKPTKPNQGDICLAWNTAVFSKIQQGQAPVGIDGWATRMMQWVYLNIKGTNRNVMFANTHGPVNQCIGQYEAWSSVADAYIKNSKGNPLFKKGDHLFFTGDFNCGGTPIAKKDPSGHGMDDIIKKMRKELTDTAQASFFYPALFEPDRIWTLKDSDIETVDWAPVCCGGPGDCKPTKMFYDQPDAAQPRCVAVPSDHMLLRGHYKVPVGATLLNATNKVVV